MRFICLLFCVTTDVYFACYIIISDARSLGIAFTFSFPHPNKIDCFTIYDIDIETERLND